jgi:NAD-dependent SIR2 family protein deacetylase
MKFLLKCPKCRNQMQYEPTNNILNKKVKKCVYCGKGFNVKKNIFQTLG